MMRVEFELIAEATEHPVATLRAKLGRGAVALRGEPVGDGSTLVVRGAHVQGEGFGPIDLGPAKLRALAAALMEMLDVDELVVEGEVRTTGAGPGRRPRRLRFTRRLRP